MMYFSFPHSMQDWGTIGINSMAKARQQSVRPDANGPWAASDALRSRLYGLNTGLLKEATRG